MKTIRQIRGMLYDEPLMQTVSKALVLGSGVSGQAAAALLRSEGADVLVADETLLDFSGFQFQVSNFRPEAAIISPGFALDHPWVVELQRQNIPLLSELELGWSRFGGRTVAVTGSNGKSTVVKWLADALTLAGQPAVACGNYGLPISEAILRPDPPEWLVIEVSSFQLETVQNFRPDVGILLNVLPNHLDRHGDMNTYRNLKLRLFENMTADDTAVVFQALETDCIWEQHFASKSQNHFQDLEKTVPNIGNPTPACGHPSAGGDSIRVHCLSLRSLPSLRASLCLRRSCPFAVNPIFFGTEKGADFRFFNGTVGDIDLSGTYFDNEVLGAAAAAVVAAGEACGLPPEVLEASARQFEPLPHRMQTVAEINGVRFVDDSKATNLAAMCAAIRMVKGPVHLIAGGRAKEKDLSFAKDLLAQQVSQLYLIGEASGAMQSAWGDRVSCLLCGTLEKAVSAARAQAKPGEVVLLSPACTSFDQFRSFADRGDEFVRAVRGRMPDGA